MWCVRVLVFGALDSETLGIVSCVFIIRTKAPYSVVLRPTRSKNVPCVDRVLRAISSGTHCTACGSFVHRIITSTVYIKFRYCFTSLFCKVRIQRFSLISCEEDDVTGRCRVLVYTVPYANVTSPINIELHWVSIRNSCSYVVWIMEPVPRAVSTHSIWNIFCTLSKLS